VTLKVNAIGESETPQKWRRSQPNCCTLLCWKSRLNFSVRHSS